MAKTALRRGSQEEGNSDYFTGCPIGGGFIWYGLPAKIPSNCRICDNSTLAISQFAKLYEAMGGSWGTDGSNINIPDLRGRFPRGVDSSASRDPDRASRSSANSGGNSGDTVGSVQDDAHQNITGATTGRVMGTFSGSGAITASNAAGSLYGGGGGNGSVLNFDASLSPGQRTSTETRPKNANVYFVIRVS